MAREIVSMRLARATTFASISCAAIVTATSSGVRAPIWMPIGACSRAISASPIPCFAQPRRAVGARLLAADRADEAGVRRERELERRHVELEVVRHQADRRPRVDRAHARGTGRATRRRARRHREPLARQEHGARVADGDAVAELLADRHERGDVVARAEEVEVRARRVRLDEDRLAVVGLDDRALADLEQRPGGGRDTRRSPCAARRGRSPARRSAPRRG